MWESPRRGQINATWEEIARMVGSDWLKIETTVTALVDKGVLDYVTDGNRNVTLTCRRMKRDENSRESAKLRVFRFRNKSSNASVTSETQKSEVIKDKDKEGVEVETTPPTPPESPFLVFQTNGKTKQWHLTKSRLLQLKELYPGVDVEMECRRAADWCQREPKKRKTVSGMERFLNTWLSKEQDKFTKTTSAKKQEAVIT
jgi:hypothetical protein